MNNLTKVDISGRTIVKFIAIILGLYFLYIIRDIIALFFIVLILVAAFSPVVEKWSKKITRPGAVIAVMTLIIASVIAAVWIVIPPFVSQSVKLFQNLPNYVGNISWVKDHVPEIKQSLSSLSGQIGNFSSGILAVTSNILSGLIAVITALVLFVYLISDEKNNKKFALSFFHDKKKEMAEMVIKKISGKAGNWLRGQLFLCLVIAVLNLIGLTIFGIPYALTLAVVSGILEFIPTIGPIMAGVLAVLVAFSESPVKAIIVVVWFIVIQQLENSLIVPKIMQKAVGLSPVVIIFAILIGAKLYGITGVIVSVPIAASLMVIVNEWSNIKKLFDNQEPLL